MDNSKLINLLKKFSTKELREFHDYVSSPYFNKNQELVLFYSHLKSLAPTFLLKKIKREVLYTAIFKGQMYNEKHLHYLMSFLLKLAEQFIGLQKYEQQSNLANYHILSACIDRDLQKNYSNIYNKSVNQLEKNPLRDTDYYYQKYLIASVANAHFKKQKIRKFDIELQKTADHFDSFYLSNKLRLTCEMLDRQKFLSANYTQNMTHEIDQFLLTNSYDHIPPIAIYHCIFNMLTKADSAIYFIQLKELLQKHFKSFEPEEMVEMYLYAINFCIRQVRAKEDKYQEEALELYLKCIEERLLYTNGYLSHWTYKNVITLGLRLQRFKWTEHFILKYNEDLEPSYQESSLHLNLAELNYHKKQLPKAQEHLIKVEFYDIFYTLHAKVLLIKIYFELHEEEALYSLLASFKIFLKRNKLISNTIRVTYLNFINLLQLLMKEKTKDHSTLQEKIMNTELLTDRQWLLDIYQEVHH